MNIPLISQLPADIATALLIGLLILAFVVAFKIMRMVFETITVSVLSAGFYTALSFLMGFSFSFNQMLTYAFLGATLYMTYSFLASAYGIAKLLLEIPYKVVLLLLKPVKQGYEYSKKKYRLWKIRKDKQSSSGPGDGDEDDTSSTKEVIIDKMKDE